MMDDSFAEDDLQVDKRLADRRAARREKRRDPDTVGRLSPEPRRWPTVMGVVVLLVLAGFASTGLKPASARVFVASAALEAGMPVVIPAGVRSTEWFCPGPLPIGSAVYSAAIELSNTGATSVNGHATIVSSAGSSRTVAFTVPAQGRAAVPVTGVQSGSSGSVSVGLSGGGVGAEEVVQAAGQTTTAPCQVRAFSHWYFASGSTAAGSDLLLALYNPGATTAVANVAFSAGAPPGTAAVGSNAASAPPAVTPISPVPFQGVVVDPGKVVVLDIGQDVQLRPELATLVTAANGRIVAGEWSQPTTGLTASGSASSTHSRIAPAGVALIAGTDQPLARWWFPLGSTPGGTVDAYWIYNPSSSPTKVSLSASLGAQVTSTLEFVVAAGSLATVVPPLPSRPKGNGVALRAAAPASSLTAGAWVEVSSQGRAGIVVARSNVTTLPSQSRARRGVPDVLISPDSVLGVAGPGREWLFSGAAATSGLDELITLANPGNHQVVVSVATLSTSSGSGSAFAASSPTVTATTRHGSPPLARGAPHGGGGAYASGNGFVVIEIVTIPAGRVLEVDLSQSGVGAEAPLLVLASGPMLAEQDYFRVGSSGGSITIGMPVG